MVFQLIKKLDNGVRIGKLSTPHGEIETPFFMPVGTVGSVKGVSPSELEDLGAQIVLSNTYHLYLRPGEQLIKKLGGLHDFMNWQKPILTDSGGYQVFSLAKNNLKFKISNPPAGEAGLKSNSNDKFSNNQINENCEMKKGKSQGLVKVTEDGVEFKSHLDGGKHLFTPEKVIQIQLDLGVDILMPLDVCPSGKATREEVEKAVDLTIEWAKRSKSYFDKQISNSHSSLSLRAHPSESKTKFLIPASPAGGSNQNLNDQMTNGKLLKNEKWEMKNSQKPLLHGIVQGGLYEDLRRYCTDELVKLNFDGYSVGGLAVDFETRDMWKIVKLMGEILPEDKQRYLMGVGTPDDIIQATKLGMDMFDCVLPTRLARHGSVYIKNPKSDLRQAQIALSNSRTGEIRNPKQILNSNIQNYKLINLLNSKYREDGGAIDENCSCPACRPCHSRPFGELSFESEPEGSSLRVEDRINSGGNLEYGSQIRSGMTEKRGFSRAYISHLIRSNEILGLRLATLHNLHQYLELMRELRVS